jgi:two-component system sensor histidine kinase HupT/HoxJ
VVCFYIVKQQNKRMLHNVFLLMIAQLAIWSVAVVIQTLYVEQPQISIIWENLTYVGSALIPVSFLLLGVAYQRDNGRFKKRYLWLYVVPAITQVMVWTNSWHHLFYLEYSPILGNQPGLYFYFHAAYSYICLLIGTINLIYFAFKHAGVLGLQAIAITVGALIPMVVNVCYTFKVPGFSLYSTPLAFGIALIIFIWAMLRYRFLKLTPVALQTVMDRMSDSFIVVNQELVVLDYNASFRNRFMTDGANRRKKSMEFFIDDQAIPGELYEQLCNKIIDAVQTRRTQMIDLSLVQQGEKRYYSVEFTPVLHRDTVYAIILLFRDITQHVLDLENLQEKQQILMEQERLASLGQMIGGIAHNLRTPIMSISGGVEQLKSLTKEYMLSIEEPEVTIQDHHEIAAEMREWQNKMSTHLAYMSDIISTVKDQAVQFSVQSGMSFTLDELLKRVNILMKHELIKYNCTLKTDIQLPLNTIMQGDVNSLVQILDNIIINAIQAYKGAVGDIILKAYDHSGKIMIEIQDFGEGIKKSIQDQLFKTMVTTKGKHGTGLGLYMAYSTIKGIFKGDLRFESEVGKGTRFYIQLPYQAQ